MLFRINTRAAGGGFTLAAGARAGLGQVSEGIHHARVEVLAGLLEDVGAGLVGGPTGAVGAVGAEGVVDIGDGEDSG